MLTAEARKIIDNLKTVRTGPLSDAQIMQVEKTLGCRFPENLVEIYRTFGVRAGMASGLIGDDVEDHSEELIFSTPEEMKSAVDFAINFNDGKLDEHRYVVFATNGIGFYLIWDTTGRTHLFSDELSFAPEDLNDLGAILVHAGIGPLVDKYDL